MFLLPLLLIRFPSFCFFIHVYLWFFLDPIISCKSNSIHTIKFKNQYDLPVFLIFHTLYWSHIANKYMWWTCVRGAWKVDKYVQLRLFRVNHLFTVNINRIGGIRERYKWNPCAFTAYTFPRKTKHCFNVLFFSS